MTFVQFARQNPKRFISYERVVPPADVLYRISRKQRVQAIGEKATIIVDLDPRLFVTMATCNARDEREIVQEAAPLASYHSKEWQSEVHPMLAVERGTGEITSHEGRHRAIAAMKAGGRWYRVAIMLRPSSRQYTIQDVPSVLWHRDCRFDLMKLGAQGKMRIVHPAVQWQYNELSRRR